jgi:transaldolase
VSRLHDLYAQEGQSPWLDNLRRGWITGGELERWVERGIRGITSNPSIFQKAIAGASDYDEQFGDLIGSGTSVDEAYWELVSTDIADALRVLRPVHDASDGLDGFVSVEVAPELARTRRRPPADSTRPWRRPTCTSRSPAPPRGSRPSGR